MGTIGAPELIIVLAIVLLIFGGKKLPELSRSLGTSIKEFRRATEESDAKTERSDADSGG